MLPRPNLANRYPMRALAAGARWLLNPVSEGGAKQVPRMLMYATGVEMLEEVEHMRAHPVGRRILAERPDLGVLLTDPSRLATMPTGSLGQVFHASMNIPGGVPGYLLAGLIYRDGFFDRYEMPDDARYVIERSRWLHDLFHVLTGYGTDLAGEGLLIFFDLGYRQRLSYRAAAITPMGLGPWVFLRPHVGMRRWRTLLEEAHARGRAAQTHLRPSCVDWEAMLSRPLDEVRASLGIVPFTEDTRDWLEGSLVGRRAASGFGAYARQAEQAQLAKRLVESGIDYRGLMRMPDREASRLRKLVAEGADEATLRETAARMMGALAT